MLFYISFGLLYSYRQKRTELNLPTYLPTYLPTTSSASASASSGGTQYECAAWKR